VTLVRFLGVPVTTFIELQSELDALQREVHLSTLGEGAGPMADDVVRGIVIQREAMVDVRTTLHEQTLAACAAGLAVADIEADYPDGARARVMAVMDASRRANDAATAGQLLTPPLRPALRHFQDWMYRQVERQLEGGPPSPYVPPS